MWITSLTKCQQRWLDAFHKNTWHTWRHSLHVPEQEKGWTFANTGAPPALRGLHSLFLTKKPGCCFFRNMDWTCPFRATIIYLLFATVSDSTWQLLAASYLLNMCKILQGLHVVHFLMSRPLNPLQMPKWVPWLAEAPGEPLCDTLQENCSAEGGVHPPEQMCGFVSARLGMSVEQLFSLPVPNSGWSLMLDRNQ